MHSKHLTHQQRFFFSHLVFSVHPKFTLLLGINSRSYYPFYLSAFKEPVPTNL